MVEKIAVYVSTNGSLFRKEWEDEKVDDGGDNRDDSVRRMHTTDAPDSCEAGDKDRQKLSNVAEQLQSIAD